MASAALKKGSDKRIDLKDAETFKQVTAEMKKKLDSGSVSTQELGKAISVYKFIPLRMEMLESGHGIFARYEWSRKQVKWAPPRRIVPYWP